jgi:hypothetical protein
MRRRMRGQPGGAVEGLCAAARAARAELQVAHDAKRAADGAAEGVAGPALKRAQTAVKKAAAKVSVASNAVTIALAAALAAGADPALLLGTTPPDGKETPDKQAPPPDERAADGQDTGALPDAGLPDVGLPPAMAAARREALLALLTGGAPGGDGAPALGGSLAAGGGPTKPMPVPPRQRAVADTLASDVLFTGITRAPDPVEALLLAAGHARGRRRGGARFRSRAGRLRPRARLRVTRACYVYGTL